MNFTISHKKPESIETNMLSLFLFQDEELRMNQIDSLSPILQKRISSILVLQKFKGEAKEIINYFSNDEIKSPRVSIIGLGKKEELTTEILRRVASLSVKNANKFKAKSISFYFPNFVNTSISIENISQSLVEGIKLGLYSYDKYKTNNKNEKIESVNFLLDDEIDVVKFQKGIVKGEIISDGVIIARDLGNAPGNEIYPETLAQSAKATAKKANFKINILNEKKIKSLKMGGVIGVSKGSVNPPRFIILEYGSNFKKNGTISLVGKGVTFDTGGISIKPSSGMAEMKMDMCGAASVIGTFYAVSKLKIPIHLVGLIPSVENMPSGNALKPGDIITHFNGKTSEVDNTDAEGRLILADALSYATKFNPDVVIDLATLTGACVVALGSHASGLMSNDKKLTDELIKNGNSTYERVCELPLYEEYENQIKSKVADVKNVGGRWAGAITAALFLKKFIGKYNWAHLDIAGTAILEENFDYSKAGASGVGVRLLTSFLDNWKK